MVARVHRHRIGDEEQIELAALGDLRAFDDDRPAAVACCGAIVAPARRMVAGSEPEYAEVHLAFDGGHRGHVWLAPRDMIRLRRHQSGKRRPDRRREIQDGPRAFPRYKRDGSLNPLQILNR